ncbi:hypothetical protein MR532_04375, partial [bacterium]|nr:hypothetical protein [bacterium]
QGLHNGLEYRADVSKVLQADPEARREWDNSQWTGPSYHWGEPEYGYFLSKDKYVIRHDISMLADAGVDVLIMDVTNAVLYWDEWEVLFSTMQEMKAEGNKVPSFCFWAFNGNVITVVKKLYEEFYKTPKYQDLWFQWDGKPLLLYNGTPSVDANPNGGEKNLSDYPQEIKDFFTLRTMWWGYWKWAGERFVGTEDKWSFGYDLGTSEVAALSPEELCSRHNGRMEEMAVTAAQHPMSIIGKSWSRKGGEPVLDERDMPTKTLIPYLGEERDNPTQYGIYFQERWDEALQVDPEFIYLNDWNEWTAGRYRQGKDPSGQADLHVDFLGRKDNPFYFVDQYNAEFNRTIAPMKGGWTDSYYMQMAQNIRRYKGVPPMPVFNGISEITLDGNLGDWQHVRPYADTRGDVIHRDHDGYGNLHYTDSTGRNDIIATRVAVGKRDLYFSAETASSLTPYNDPRWMLLLIDSDQDAATGWHGFDYIVNLKVVSERLTTLQRFNDETRQWELAAEIPYATKGNVLEVSIPRKLLGKGRNHIALDFKWTDNPSSLDDIISLCTSGDTAPNRRFAYRFTWKR